MDTLIGAMGTGYFILGLLAVCVLTSATNRRMLAAWLIASAKAMEERRAAYQGIRHEMRIYQLEIQSQHGVDRESMIHRR